MKSKWSLVIVTVLLLLSTTAKSQVLISLIFGDKLNSDKIEFGLVGGENIAFINDIPDSKSQNFFNLGFYFHINLKNQSYISTGVLVKSSVGASGMATFPIGDDNFDSLFQDGELTRRINYFYVPIMYHQRLSNNRWYIEGGFQPGLRNKAINIFEKEELGGDLSYEKDARDEYIRFDVGLIGGVGYKLKREIKSTAVGINYYYGLANVSKIEGTTIKNSSVYFYVKIPIGAAKAEKKQAASDHVN